MKKIISFILGSLVALTMSITVANAAAFATVIDIVRATKLPKMKLIIFFILSPLI